MTQKTMFLYLCLLRRNSLWSIVACFRYIQSEVIIFVAKAYFNSPSSTFKHHVYLQQSSWRVEWVTWWRGVPVGVFHLSDTLERQGPFPGSCHQIWLPPLQKKLDFNWTRASPESTSDLRWKLVQDHPSYSLIGRIEIPTPSLSAELLSNTHQKLEFQQVSFEPN